MAPPKHSSWDPLLLISQVSISIPHSFVHALDNFVSQIVSVQTLHYVTLSILIPPLLSIFAEPNSLNYEGGAANVGMKGLLSTVESFLTLSSSPA